MYLGMGFATIQHEHLQIPGIYVYVIPYAMEMVVVYKCDWVLPVMQVNLVKHHAQCECLPGN